MDGYKKRFLCGLAPLLVTLLFVGGVGTSTTLWAKEQPLAVGDKAPDFELPIQGRDDYLALSELIDDGPVVVIVLRGYPGYQCSHCKRQFNAFVNRANVLSLLLGEKPNRVVLVYPGEKDGLEQRARQFIGTRRIPAPLVLVRDPDMEMVAEWGLRWDRRRETAYPAAYLIGPGRRVKWAEVSRSHGDRASVEDVVKAIKDL